MKKVIGIIATIIVVALCGFYIINKADNKKEEAKESAPIEDTKVYVDCIGCLHTDKDCLNLFENYAVKIYEKTDPELSSKYEYVCIHCFKPEHLIKEKVDWDQFK